MMVMTFKTRKPIVEDMGDRILTTDEVLKILPVSKSTLWRLEKQGIFPMHFKIGPRKNGWMESEVVSWIDNVQEGNLNGKA